MLCPRCSYKGETHYGECPRCGYVVEEMTTTRTSGQLDRNTLLTATRVEALMRGDVVHGHYRLVEYIALPKNQQRQGLAWFAVDTQHLRNRVIIRQVRLPETDNPQHLFQAVVTRMRMLAEHAGFPPVVDMFYEREQYYLVQQAPAGEALASLMRRQGGALDEREVAAYGRQLCEILSVLATHQPPLVHGAINPETLQVTLLFTPLFTPDVLQKSTNTAGYVAPEQARGEFLPSSDLYAVAAVLHHAVTGYNPDERLAHFYPPARRLNPLVSAGMETILGRELRLSVKQRYPGPEAMQQELITLLASYPAISTTPVSQLLNGMPSSFNGITTPFVENTAFQAKSRSSRNLWFVIGTSVFLLLALLLVTFIPPIMQKINTSSKAPSINVAATSQASTQAEQAALQQQLNIEMQNFRTNGIGISDGRMIFDTYKGRGDITLKQQAAIAIQRGDMSTAVNMLNQAVSADPIDGEAQIYNEDIHLLQNNSPYTTIVVGLPIDGSDVYLESARIQLQAVYLAQHETNSKNLLPGGLKLRILIANSSSNNDNVAKVAQFIADRVNKSGNLDHIVAVVGWPYSTQTINARDIIAGVHIPLISQTSSSVKLSGSSPYFFRVCPADDLQGKALGTLLINKLKTKKILILHDPTDLYSTSLANAVAERTTGLGAVISNGTFTEKTTSVQQYEQMVISAMQNNTDTIFMAGYNVDGIRLAHAVGNQARLHPFSTLLNNLKVVGGDTMASGVLVGRGNDADAALARTFPQDMRRLTVTSYADVNEWNLLKVPQNKQPIFFGDWISTYQGSALGTNAPDPTYESMLIYDAVGIVTHTLTLIHGTPSGEQVRDMLTLLGTGKAPAYQGVSGRITFDDKGDPIDKAIVVLTIQDNGKGNEITVQQVIGTFQ